MVAFPQSVVDWLAANVMAQASNAPPVDIKSVAILALSNADNLLREWFPAGKRVGHEFVVGNLLGEPGESLSINTNSGVWSDFASGEKGGDLVSLYAAIHRMSQGGAARELGEELGAYQLPVSASAPVYDTWEPMVPPPAGVAHPTLSGIVHTYCDTDGNPTHYVRRTEATGANRKQFYPLTYGKLNGVLGWHRKHAGTPRPLYGLDRLAHQPAATVIICEGEKATDAAAALFPDHACVTWPGGTNAVQMADFSPLANRAVIIWPDNDQPGRRAAAEIAANLPDARLLRVDDLPAGADAADIGPLEAPLEWLAGRIAKPAGQTKGLRLIWAGQMQPRLFAGGTLMKGILDEGAMSVVYAPSNVGKSFFCLDVAFHIAMGWDWRGRKIKARGAVVYIATEGGVGFVNRVAALKLHHGISNGCFVPLAVVPCPVNLLDPKADTPEVVKLIRDVEQEADMPVVLTVVDTLSRAMAGGDENSPKDMTAFVANVDTIRQANSAPHVMIVHHAGKDVARGARGHSSLRAATDSEIEIALTGNGKEACASVKKQRDLPGDENFLFTLKSVLLGEDEDGDPVTSAVIEHLGEQQAKKAIKRTLTSLETAARSYLSNLVAKEGKPLPTGTDFPHGMLGVPEEIWREECETRRLSTADNEHDRARSFRRAYRTLLDKRQVGSRDGIVWLTSPDADTLSGNE